MKEHEVLDLDTGDLAPCEIPVRLKGEDYYLKDATSTAVKNWQAAIMRAHKPGPAGGMVPTDALPATEVLLVQACMWKRGAGKNGEDVQVTHDFIKGLTGKQQKELFDKCKRINGVHEDGPSTVKELERKIKEMQERLEKLKATEDGGEQGEEGSPKT